MPRFRLTKSQIASVKRAAKLRKSVTLTLSHKDLDPLGHELAIHTALLSDGKRHRIKVHPPVITKEGGILPLIPIIAGLIAAGAATAGGVATAVKGAKESKAADRMAEAAVLKSELLKKELARSGSGFYLKREGKGFHLRSGHGFHLKSGKGSGRSKKRK